MTFLTSILREELVPIDLEDDGLRFAGKITIKGDLIPGGYPVVCHDNPHLVNRFRFRQELQDRDNYRHSMPRRTS